MTILRAIIEAYTPSANIDALSTDTLLVYILVKVTRTLDIVSCLIIISLVS